MSASQYGKYTLISRPHYDEKLKSWIPYSSVFWPADKFHYHQLHDHENTFHTVEEALAFGYATARAWIEEHKSG